MSIKFTEDEYDYNHMPLRYFFAAHAMEGLIAGALALGNEINTKGIAIKAFVMADTMLEEGKKEK